MPDTFFAVPDPCAETYTLIGDVTLPESFFAPVATVTFAFNASAPLQAFQVRVSYPIAKGTFVGSAGNVSCTSDGGGIFTKNENDANGTLVLSTADTSNLTFPITIRCGFSAVGTVAGRRLHGGRGGGDAEQHAGRPVHPERRRRRALIRSATPP